MIDGRLITKWQNWHDDKIDCKMTRLKMTTIDDKSITRWQDDNNRWQIDRKMTRLIRGQNPN